MNTSTITGNLLMITGEARACELKFEPRSTPLALSDAIVTTTSKKILSDENGDFSIELAIGDYKLTIACEDIIYFTVPSDPDATYDLLMLITSSIAFDPDSVGDWALVKSQNLGDIIDAETARANIDVYSKEEVDNLISGFPPGVNVRFSEGQFQIWDNTGEGWRSLSADGGILGLGALVPDA